MLGHRLARRQLGRKHRVVERLDRRGEAGLQLARILAFLEPGDDFIAVAVQVAAFGRVVGGAEHAADSGQPHRMPTILWVWTDSRQRPSSMQRWTAAAVFASISGPSIGCRKKCSNAQPAKSCGSAPACG